MDAGTGWWNPQCSGVCTAAPLLQRDMIMSMTIRISNDKNEINLDQLMSWLNGSYWAESRTIETQRRAIEGSSCFSAFADDKFVGFCRVVTDGATFAWLCDVIIDPAERGSGIGKALISAVITHPDLACLRMALATRDAHELYRRYGFSELAYPENWMGRGFRNSSCPA